MKTIDKQIALGRQSVQYTEILSIDNVRFKISIKSDSYSFQSYAKIFRWDGSQWKSVHSIHYQLMQTPHCMYVWKEIKYKNLQNFKADRDQLIKVATEVCCAAA